METFEYSNFSLLFDFLWDSFHSVFLCIHRILFKPINLDFLWRDRDVLKVRSVHLSWKHLNFEAVWCSVQIFIISQETRKQQAIIEKSKTNETSPSVKSNDNCNSKMYPAELLKIDELVSILRNLYYAQRRLVFLKMEDGAELLWWNLFPLPFTRWKCLLKDAAALRWFHLSLEQR